MATNSPLIKVLIIYFGINILLYAGGVRLGQLTVGGANVGDLISSSNSSADITDSSVQYGLGNISSQTPDVNDQTGGFSSALSFIDVLRSVRTLINFLVVAFGGVFIVFLLFPPVVQLFVGLPLAFMFLIGLIYFVRSGQ